MMPRSPTRRLLFIFVSLLISACLCHPPKEHSQVARQVQNAPVLSEALTITKVIDGDTFVLSNGERIRLTGIDTPESYDNAKARRDSQRSGQDVRAITQQGKEATQFVRNLAQGKKVRIEYDVQKRDRYGRLLVYVYDIDTLRENPQTQLSEGLVADANHEIFLNGSIISSGYAIPMTIPPNVKHADLFKKLYSDARSHKRGLWAQ